MKKFVIICLLSLLLVGCGKTTPALTFKKAYESLNGVEISGRKIRSVSISSENPYVTIFIEELLEKIENKETFFVYFGSKYCPWCRSVIESSIEVAKEQGVSTIYYVEIWDGMHEELFRDQYEVQDGELIKTKEGTEDYQKILEAFDKVLKDYTITSNGETYSVGEKRVYAPNFIFVKNGEAKALTEGISSLQTDSMGTLTTEIKEEQKELFQKFFEEDCEC